MPHVSARLQRVPFGLFDMFRRAWRTTDKTDFKSTYKKGHGKCPSI